MSQNPNRDIDLLKVNLVSDYRTAWLMAFVGIYFVLMIGLSVAWYQTQLSLGFGFYIVVAVIVVVHFALVVTQELLPYIAHVKQVDLWLRMMDNNERLPELSEMYRSKNRLKPLGHGILIFLVLVDFILAVLGVPPLWLLAIFLPVGFVVSFLTQGGIDWMRRQRRR